MPAVQLLLTVRIRFGPMLIGTYMNAILYGVMVVQVLPRLQHPFLTCLPPMFVAWRIRIISQATWLALSIGLFSIVSLGGGIWLTVAVVQSRRKTGFNRTDDTINRTGLVTAVFAILDVHTTINFVWDFALSKLYSNALISTLNARTGWGSLTDRMYAPNVLFGDEGLSPQLNSTSNSRMTPKTAGHLGSTYIPKAHSALKK
ncbi:hypothetical protein BDZ94DRAFT_1238932 [Collybia nuda]|uniref:Uncharacterized protein n=1 Tax=Collybia nuda TaxID=64659 RepID=A0A9P6CBP8_9AGAR|nr:hypothetical protein BDZ94DRAFT_1238932 [Collybia nuda]